MSTNSVIERDLPDYGYRTFNMPTGAKVMHVAQVQRELRLWAKADESKPLEQRTFLVAYGESSIPENAVHIGTVINNQETNIRHIFEVIA